MTNFVASSTVFKCGYQVVNDITKMCKWQVKVPLLWLKTAVTIFNSELNQNVQHSSDAKPYLPGIYSNGMMKEPFFLRKRYMKSAFLVSAKNTWGLPTPQCQCCACEKSRT